MHHGPSRSDAWVIFEVALLRYLDAKRFFFAKARILLNALDVSLSDGNALFSNESIHRSRLHPVETQR